MADDTSQSQSQGPSWSKLGGLMQVADPQLLVNLGLGIASAAKYGGNLGDGLMGAMNNYTQQKAAQQNYRINALNLQRQRAIMSMLPGLMGGQVGPSPPGGVPQNSPPSAAGGPANGLLSTSGTTQPVAPAVPVASPAPPVEPQPQFLSPPSAADIEGLSVGGMNPRLLPAFNLLSGKDPLAGDAEIRAAQLQRAQQQFAPQIAQLSSVVKSDDPVRDVQSDQSLMATWRHYAVARGLDPDKDLKAPNVRQVMGGVANAYRQQLGQPESEIPEEPENVSGPYGQALQISRGGTTPGKVTEVSGQKPPSLSLEKVFNPNTGGTTGKLVPTSVGGQPVPGFPVGASVTGGGGRGSGTGLGSTAATVDLGFQQPNAENNKAAMFAGEMRSGMTTLNSMEQKGFQLSPTARAFAINMATQEDAGVMSQLFSQEVAAHKLNAQEQTYIAAMMPLLQAAGHDQSGARLSTGQVRQNVEGLLPLGTSKSNLDQVHQNRDGFYTGLLTQAGPALQLPQYRSTLLADLLQRQNAATSASRHPPNIEALLKKYSRASAAPQ